MAIIVLYPATVGLFYIVYRRIGQHLGVSAGLSNAAIALVVVVWLFLCSGDPAAQSVAFLLAAAAAFCGGASVGEGLAVIATGRRLGFRDALRSLPRLNREAKRQSWLGAVNAVKGVPR